MYLHSVYEDFRTENLAQYTKSRLGYYNRLKINIDNIVLT